MQQKTLNNRYELEQKIGEGGMARVYRGRDLRLNRRVAIKVLHAQYAGDASFLNRFQHEAQAAANLRHPNIVDVYDVGQDGDIHYIVMEFVEGEDLKNIIMMRGPLPVDEAVDIAEQVTNGLQAAHAIGLIHRDIKPQNIIVEPSGLVKITDFGIAKSRLSTAATETGVIFGTADYISPEQARGLPATPASDIYSLGITLYEMLTGRLPFTGENSIAVAMQHVSAEPPPPRMYNPRIPPQLEALVLRTLSKDPAQRPASARELGALLHNYASINEQQTVVRPVVPYPEPRPQPRPQPRVQQQPRPIRTTPQTSTTSRTTLPRPAVTTPPPERSGGGFGGFLLGLLLIAGVLGLAYVLISTGLFQSLMTSFASSGPSAPPTNVAATSAPTAAPTAGPTAVPTVTVPSIIGTDEQSAIAALTGAGLKAEHDTRADRNSADVPNGAVLDQLPAAGATITETGTVTYGLSLGPAIEAVPDVTRLRANVAQATLQQAGFKVETQQEPSQSIDEGFVTRQSPSPGLRIQKGQTVTIFVSIGNKVQMPDVTGMSLDQAKQRIQQAGLILSYADLQGPDKIPNYDQLAPNTVVSSVPRGGELVERGTGVTLGVRAP